MENSHFHWDEFDKFLILFSLYLRHVFMLDVEGWKVRCLKIHQTHNFKFKLHAQIRAYKEYKFLLFFASHSSQQRYNTLVCLQWKWISVSRTVNEGIENSKNFFYYDNHLNEARACNIGVHNLICYNFAVLSLHCGETCSLLQLNFSKHSSTNTATAARKWKIYDFNIFFSFLLICRLLE